MENEKKEDKYSWFKAHADAISVIGAICLSMTWMNGKFNDVQTRFGQVDKKISEIEKEIAVVKTVLLMKNILPSELAAKEEKK